MRAKTRFNRADLFSGKKVFFSEEKNQKTLASAVAAISGGTNT
jgi:hypothetical protein